MTKTIQFTPAQVHAVLHRLDIGGCIAGTFGNTDELEHLAGQTEVRAPPL